MTCDRLLTKYFELDKNQLVPVSVFLHLLICPSCRTTVRSLTKAEKLLAKPLKIRKSQKNLQFEQNPDPTIQLVLDRIKASGYEFPHPDYKIHTVSMGPWLFSGLFLLIGFTIFPFSSLGQWAHTTFGIAFSLPFYIVTGICITIYCGIFIASNIDFFIKKFGFS